LPLQYDYGAGGYGVGQYATSVFAVSSNSATATAVGERIQSSGASAASSSAESAAAQRVRESASTVASTSATSGQALRVRDADATAASTSGANQPSGEFIVAANFDPADSTTAATADALRIGTGGATVASVSVGTILAERIQQPAANAPSFSGFNARANITARGQAFSQTSVSASASTGRILWTVVPDNPPADWRTIGANGLPLAA
jgi:hypothetical protein